MYSVFVDNICLYDDRSDSKELTLIEPVLELEENAPGTFEFTVIPDNPCYDLIQKMASEIVVRENGVEIWSGRVTEETSDFYNRRKIHCEGELSYLKDITIPPAEYHDITVRQFIETVLNFYNSKVGQSKRFAVGIVTVTDSNDSLYRYTNYEDALLCIKEKLVERLGGHLRIRKENGIRYLDYLSDYPQTSSQVIRFGTNLLDFTKSYNVEDLATVIIPLGAALDESPIEALTAYLDVSSVNDGSIYVQSNEAVATYGRIERVVRWDDVEEASNLLRKAQQYLHETQFDEMQLEVSAIDMSYIDVNAENIKLLDRIRVISSPHGLDRLFPVTRLSIPLDNPEEAVFQLGTSVCETFTQSTSRGNSEILSKIQNIPPPSTMLESARNNASQLIRNATHGFVTILQNNDQTQEILISDLSDYENASRLWRWNLNGLGYSSTGYNGQYDLAMTMDGEIVADRITTGELSADRIRGGTLTLGGIDDAHGLYCLKDGTGRPAIVMSNNGMSMVSNDRYYMNLGTDGKITGGIYSGNIGEEYLSDLFDQSNYSCYGIFDASAEGIDTATQQRYRGFRIKTPYLNIVAEHVSTIDSMSDTAVSLWTVKNENIPYVKSIRKNIDGSITFSSGYLQVVNGLIVSY